MNIALGFQHLKMLMNYKVMFDRYNIVLNRFKGRRTDSQRLSNVRQITVPPSFDSQ